MEENTGVKQRMTALFLTAAAGWSATMAGFYAVLKSATAAQMPLLLACLAGGLLLTGVLYPLLRRAAGAVRLRPAPAVLWWVTAALAFAGVAALDVDRYFTEQQNLDQLGGRDGTLLWQGVDIRWTAAAVLCAFLILLGAAGREPEQPRSDRWEKLLLGGVYLLCAGLYAAKLYAPNIAADDCHHMTAVLQSVHNVYYNTPFTVETSSIYGHYALFLWPFLRRLGHAPVTVAKMFSLISFLTELLVLYMIHHSVRSNTLRVAAALASITTQAAMEFSTYWQLHPLRILPAALILAYGTWCICHGERLTGRRIVFGYVLCALGVTFATDTGIVSTAAWSVWICRWYWQREPLFSRRMCRVYAGAAAGCAGAVAGMVLAVNFYNVVICHAAPVLRACFYPMLGGGTYVADLLLPPRWMNCSWLWVAALFFAAVVIGMAGTRFVGIETENSGRLLLLLFCGVMGIGQSFYYYNRAAYFNVSIILPEAVCCMAIMAEWGLLALKRQIKEPKLSIPAAVQTGAALAVAAQLAVLALATAGGAGLLLEKRQEAGRFSMLTMWKLKEEVRQVVPEDTYAFGWLTQELYADLGWDPQYHLLDTSDLFGEGLEGVLAEVNAQTRLLVHKQQLPMLDPAVWETGDVQKIPVPAEDPIFYYYIRESNADKTE